MFRIFPVTAGLMSFALLLSGCGGGGGSGGSDEDPPDLAGVIDIESGTRVDSDTADDIRLGESVDNGAPGSAQPLPFGAIVGGYLSFNEGIYNAGTADPFSFVIDTKDLYATELSPRDRVAVQVSGHRTRGSRCQTGRCVSFNSRMEIWWRWLQIVPPPTCRH